MSSTDESRRQEKQKSGDYVLTLAVTTTKGKKTRARFRPGVYDVGRAPDCAVRFWKRAKAIALHHARITVDEDGASIEDLESDTGTMVNGRVVHETTLENGDTIAIGPITMRVKLPERQAATGQSEVILSAPEEQEVEESAKGLAEDLQELEEATQQVGDEIAKRIVGQEETVRLVWATILARGHCLLVGVPGLAKTLLVSTFGEVLGLQSKRIQFTPDLMPSDIIGSNILHEGEDGRRFFEFAQGPIFTQLLLADEINRTPPKTQAALLEAMQERQVTVAHKSLSLPEPFCVIATQNPIEQEGTYPLPEAQLDRFMLCLRLTYPEDTDEVDILLQTTRGITPQVDAAMGFEDILRYQEMVNRIAVSRSAAVHASRIVRMTRPDEAGAPEWVERIVDWGAGPRAGQSLLRVAKALAAMDGRPAISVDDVLDVCLPVLRHRISCNYRARAEGMDQDAVVGRVMEEVPEP
ncbi:MAG: AAA family ATPase [Planctomycetota bacterium]|jgi:MoxR-like ATPase